MISSTLGDQLNEKYRKIFGYTPSFADYHCNNDEFINAMTTAIKEKREISDLLLIREARDR